MIVRDLSDFKVTIWVTLLQMAIEMANLKCAHRVGPATKGHLRWRTMGWQVADVPRHWIPYPFPSPLPPTYRLCCAYFYNLSIMHGLPACLACRPARSTGSVGWKNPLPVNICMYVLPPRLTGGAGGGGQRLLCRWPTNLSQSQSFWRHISRALNMHRNNSVSAEGVRYATH